MQMMKRLPCLTCSVNITLVGTKWEYAFNLWHQYNFFLPEIFFRFCMVYYCDLPGTNPVVDAFEIMFVKTFLDTGLV